MLHRSLGSGLSGALCGEGVDFLLPRKPRPPEEAQDRALPCVGDGDHGVVEGRTDVSLTTFDVLLFAATADNLLAVLAACHSILPPYFFLLAMVFLGPLRVRALVLLR